MATNATKKAEHSQPLFRRLNRTVMDIDCPKVIGQHRMTDRVVHTAGCAGNQSTDLLICAMHISLCLARYKLAIVFASRAPFLAEAGDGERIFLVSNKRGVCLLPGCLLEPSMLDRLTGVLQFNESNIRGWHRPASPSGSGTVRRPQKTFPAKPASAGSKLASPCTLTE
jgi:hypothetical protein